MPTTALTRASAACARPANPMAEGQPLPLPFLPPDNLAQLASHAHFMSMRLTVRGGNTHALHTRYIQKLSETFRRVAPGFWIVVFLIAIPC